MRRLRAHLTYANVMSTIAVMGVVAGGTAYAAATIGTDDVIDESLLGADVKDASLKNTDLGVTLRGGHQPDTTDCAALAFADCVSVSFGLRRPQRVLLIASGLWFNEFGSGECLFEIDDNGTFYDRTNVGDAETEATDHFAMNAVTGPIAKGSHHVDVTCRTIGGQFDIANVDLAVAAIGDGA